jgi:hypothetical protein
VTLGDATTKLFHAHATVKYRKNFITHLMDDQGNMVTDHNEKAELIWQSFKQRLGTSNFNAVHFNLSAHFANQLDLSDLVQPFSTEKIDAVIRSLPSNKALGPDGFNTDFIKSTVGLLFLQIFISFVMLSILALCVYKALMVLILLWSQRKMMLSKYHIIGLYHC